MQSGGYVRVKHASIKTDNEGGGEGKEGKRANWNSGRPRSNGGGGGFLLFLNRPPLKPKVKATEQGAVVGFCVSEGVREGRGRVKCWIGARAVDLEGVVERRKEGEDIRGAEKEDVREEKITLGVWIGV